MPCSRCPWCSRALSMPFGDALTRYAPLAFPRLDVLVMMIGLLGYWRLSAKVRTSSVCLLIAARAGSDPEPLSFFGFVP